MLYCTNYIAFAAYILYNLYTLLSLRPGNEKSCSSDDPYNAAHSVCLRPECGDKPSEKTPDSVPEAFSAYYDYTSLEPIVSENSELPLSDDAQIGTTDHLGLWYNGEYSFIKAGGDGGYTVDELMMIDPTDEG